MRKDVIEAMQNKISIINGLHSILNNDKEIKKISEDYNVNIHDIRESKEREKLNFWSGKIYDVKAPKIVVLGTDCGLGKRTTAKLIVENLQMNNVKSCL